MFTAFPPTSSNPVGCCIQALAETTRMAEAAPPSATGMPQSQCWRGVSRFQP